MEEIPPLGEDEGSDSFPLGGAWDFILTWSDSLFHRQFFIAKDDFFKLCETIKSNYPGTHSSGYQNYTFAQLQGYRSNPKSGPITMEIKLAITLRLIRGASALDMVWYGVQIQTVPIIFSFIIQQIDIALDNDIIFNFNPISDGAVQFRLNLDQISSEWSELMKAKIISAGNDLLKGTVLAGDGFVAAITAPTKKELLASNLPLSAFRNRKGCFGLIVQGFSDAYAKFRYFEVKWPGSTNDITAYKQTKLYSWFQQKLIPDCFHMVLDEAYSSIGGNQHLCPFTRHQLRRAREKSEELYCQMKCFNHLLSSQRITVERMFGLYVRKAGILARPLEHSLALNILILKVSAKLHNLSIEYWKKHGKNSEEIHRYEMDHIQQRDSGVFQGWGDADLYDLGNERSDEDINLMYGNHLLNEITHRTTSQRKKDITKGIFDAGIRYHVNMDNDFTYNNGGMLL
jgi:hypothetical protein